jgi:O-acetyl-ADP-ribose deacetylase (regulator of RNase III)
MSNLPILKNFLSGRVMVLLGDITLQRVDAVVNAANSSLMGGGGVDGAIHSSGGPRILAECREIRRARFPSGLPTGEAVLTTGGDLPARYVIHTVGPMRSTDPARDAELLAASYRNSLTLAAENALHSVAFPAISTGIFGYPRDDAARIASVTIEAILAKPTSVNEVRLVFFEGLDARVFLQHQKFSA